MKTGFGSETPTHCALCRKALPGLDGKKAALYKPQHAYARGYACPKCLAPFATDVDAMAAIGPVVADKERRRMARVAKELQAEAAARKDTPDGSP